jgi:hypothetical protein
MGGPLAGAYSQACDPIVTIPEDMIANDLPVEKPGRLKGHFYKCDFPFARYPGRSATLLRGNARLLHAFPNPNRFLGGISV